MERLLIFLQWEKIIYFRLIWLGCDLFGGCPNSFNTDNQPPTSDLNRAMWFCSLDVGGSNCYCDSFHVNHKMPPTRYNMYQNYPNPFNPITSIKFDLPMDTYVKLKVYDLSGREVVTLVDGLTSSGSHSAVFDGNNLASGVYIYKFETPGFSDKKKMVLVK